MNSKKVCWVVLLFSFVLLFPALVAAQNKVVVIPLMEDASGPPAPVPKSGQTACYYDNGTTGTCTCGTSNCPASQDGALEKGVAWPNPRFTLGLHSNNFLKGTVIDNLTGLTWMRLGECSRFHTYDNVLEDKYSWANAIYSCDQLKSGFCGLNDGSVAGDWRLPNINELLSLIDRSRHTPALTAGLPFTVESLGYWSATTSASDTRFAWSVYFRSGHASSYGKTYAYNVRCVR